MTNADSAETERARAEHRCAAIKKYWADRGIVVEAWIVEELHRPRPSQKGFTVYTIHTSGIPTRGFHK